MHKSNLLPVERASQTFIFFLLRDKANCRVVGITFLILVTQFVLFKLLYPYPDFFSDSYSYLFAAYAHLDISVWPIGYSKFLDIFHRITWSDTALVAFQYFFLQGACLFLYFTLLYFFNPGAWFRRIFWFALFVNPLALYLCNLVNSDALFAGLSVTWLTQLIWLIRRPGIQQLIIQALLLFLCFTVRNNAYYYPLVTIFGILLTKHSWKLKLLGVILPFLLIVPFVLHTREMAYKLTGTRQFSFFSGWMLANNALYIYDQIKVDSNALTTPEAKELNRMALTYFSQVNRNAYRKELESFVGNFFIKQPKAPLKTYLQEHYEWRDEMGCIIAWGKASAAFAPFGKTIILHHPLAYFRYFVWPNFLHYILPPLSNLEIYNYGINEVSPIAQYWFHYPRSTIHCFSADFQNFLLIYTALFCFLNLFLVWDCVMSFYNWYHLKPQEKRSPVLLVIFCFVILNFIFSLISTVDMLRYQYTPMIAIMAIGLLLSDYQLQLTAIRRPNKTYPFLKHIHPFTK